MTYLTEEQIIFIHDKIISKYGGANGILNKDLIQSLLFSSEYYNDIIEVAASYMYKLNKDHIFRDGNKRTSCVATIEFLKLNNYTISISNEDLYELQIQIAENKITEQMLAMKLVYMIKKII